jgi:uncharacterized repeat protein (TIGR03843 family)
MGTSNTEALERLARGEITLRGRMPRSSNATFLVEIAATGGPLLAVYKPARGERPLWDFPPGLFRREVAAWELSQALGWGLVPPTVQRDGPLGEGSLQEFIEADFAEHYFTLREADVHRERLQQICVFDLLANNADRKSGHCLLGPDGRVWAIDNALTFHVEPKLRTVIWDFGGDDIPPAILEDVQRLQRAGLAAPLAELLEPVEQRALLKRARALVKAGRFPDDDGGYRTPWPLV